MTHRDQLIEKAMEQCYVPPDVGDYGEFQKTPTVVGVSYRIGFADGTRATLTAIEALGYVVMSKADIVTIEKAA